MLGGGLRWLAVAGLSLALIGCGRIIPEGRVPPPVASVPVPRKPVTPAATALTAGFAAGPAISSLGLRRDDARGALLSFRTSCPRLTSRSDSSGLTQPGDWKPACAAAAKWPETEAAQFFATWFEAVRIGDGKAFVTGYYEPQIAGVRTRRPGYDVPVYGLPADLVRARPGDAPPNPNGTQPLGRYDEQGRFVPYFDRGEIEDGALMGKGLEIAWAADPVELFFLQVQGSGRLVGPDGAVMHIGYAGQNGHAYTGIGGLMRDRGLLGSGPGKYSGSMQGIMQYIHENPETGRALMRENKSYVFFREIGPDGPLGALGVPVRARDSVAADPAFVPLGAPVWLELDRGEASGLWVAQDTGGAIKGANRFDSFWGAGDTARTIAGGMSGRGEALLLLPKGTLKKLQQAR
ncbi:murein transglycosylase A [Novosphingobium sp.]|uniref:murein transglycosylase A n=1 Tax=Novosphingobium sp. TaxID=1874826 RepID=UPI0035B3C13A